jgi:hypothetical protein
VILSNQAKLFENSLEFSSTSSGLRAAGSTRYRTPQQQLYRNQDFLLTLSGFTGRDSHWELGNALYLPKEHGQVLYGLISKRAQQIRQRHAIQPVLSPAEEKYRSGFETSDVGEFKLPEHIANASARSLEKALRATIPSE